MNLIYFISVLLGLLAVSFLAGKKVSQRSSSNEEYFLAGKSVKFFPLFMTFLATQVGGGLVLGSAEEAYQYGWMVFLYPLGAALGLMILGLGIGRKLSEFKVTTTAQILEVAYGSRALKRIGSLLSIVSLFMILVAQIIASAKFLSSLGMNSHLLFVLCWGIVILYTVRGLKAVIATDVVQATFFTVIFVVAFIFAMISPHFSLNDLADSAVLNSFSQANSKWCGWIFMPLLFMVIEQDMGQRCFAGGSPKIISRATFWSGVVTLGVCLVPISFGIMGKTLGITIPKGASVLMIVTAQMTTPFVAACVGTAVLAAIISTAASLINAISSNLSEDFSFLRSKNNMNRVKAITIAISLLALFFSRYCNSIVDLLIQSYELSVSALFVPTLIALYKKKGNFLSALLAILFGMASFVLFRFVPVIIPREVMSVLLSLAGFGMGELIVWKRASQYV